VSPTCVAGRPWAQRGSTGRPPARPAPRARGPLQPRLRLLPFVGSRQTPPLIPPCCGPRAARTYTHTHPLLQSAGRPRPPAAADRLAPLRCVCLAVARLLSLPFCCAGRASPKLCCRPARALADALLSPIWLLSRLVLLLRVPSLSHAREPSHHRTGPFLPQRPRARRSGGVLLCAFHACPAPRPPPGPTPETPHPATRASERPGKPGPLLPKKEARV
jgi:hypothetical protein